MPHTFVHALQLFAAGMGARGEEGNAMNKNHVYIGLFTVIAAMFLTSCGRSRVYPRSPSPENSRAYPACADGGAVFCYSPEMAVPLNTEEYRHYDENRLRLVKDAPLSTFGADVDTAGYANTRRMLKDESRLPPRDAVRVEEFLNYFEYAYPQPPGDGKFSATFEMGQCPWNAQRQLLLVGIQGKTTELTDLPPSSFVFLIDNSGSMHDEMPLLREAMSMLARQMRPQDKLGIVTYGGGARVLIESAGGDDAKTIQSAIAELTAGGYTTGAAGRKTATSCRQELHQGRQKPRRLVTEFEPQRRLRAESRQLDLAESRKQRGTGVFLTLIGMGYRHYKTAREDLATANGTTSASLPCRRRAMPGNEIAPDVHAGARRQVQVEFNRPVSLPTAWWATSSASSRIATSTTTPGTPARLGWGTRSACSTNW